jgi:hypothetical protein
MVASGALALEKNGIAGKDRSLFGTILLKVSNIRKIYTRYIIEDKQNKRQCR